jgi:hypothetical protein
MFSRGHPDDTTMPCYVDSDNARQFFKDAFKIEPLDLVRKFELWSVNRDKCKSCYFGIDQLINNA